MKECEEKKNSLLIDEETEAKEYSVKITEGTEEKKDSALMGLKY